MDLSSEDVLFVSKGSGVVPWYRCGQVAFHLGCDWVGIIGSPPNLGFEASLKRGGHGPVEFGDYKIIVLQQVAGIGWFNEIAKLRKAGIKVIYEVDDYLHGVAKLAHHGAKESYTKDRIIQHELCMRACDAMIVSTEWLARRYRKFNANIYVCRNSVDAPRYAQFELPERKSINIGWAGGEGHLDSMRKWLPAVEAILGRFAQTRFLSMGLPVADLLKRPKQAVSLPFISIENFPAALTNFDIALAPAGRQSFFAAKSDLRFLETGALAIPLIADPFVYRDIEDDVTGMLAETPEEVEQALEHLIINPDKAKAMGRRAQKYIQKFRSIETAIEQWEHVFVEVALDKKIAV